ncbi:DUF4440 domain-containing protein [Spirosoma sp. BT702]|uniref:DUF4440 domain-containing protein n=1 Tax=Spirosoma profusum TaxID=2771354 RepID=A0A927AVA5_9BACT|nr:DUF4440 domain-containing protein [Spirosoma profusum]MBD2705072.1 DUF4440 domain-containing protein [Spirosoma profusum]
MNKRVPLFLFFVCSVGQSYAQTSPASASLSPDQQTILQLERELVNAYNTADAKTYERLLADDMAVYITNSGRVRTKQRLLAGLTTVTPDDKCEIMDMSVNVWDNSAVTSGILIYTPKNQKGAATRYSRVTNMFLKRPGGWQLVAAHFTPMLWWQVRPPEDKQLIVLKALDCSQESALRSPVEVDVRAYMKTTNLTDKPISSQWITYDGKRDSTQKVTIEPGQSRDVYTFLNNAFIVTDTDGKCLAIYKAQKEPGLMAVK